jgi:hypothetical protein
MSRVLKFDRKFYGDDGLLSLYRGDDWSIYGTVVDRVNAYETLVDLSQYGATGYFPSATGGADLPATAITGSCGVLTISLPAATTPLVQSSTGGEGAYIVLQDSMGNLTTVPTIDQALAILDRGFPTG